MTTQVIMIFEIGSLYAGHLRFFSTPIPMMSMIPSPSISAADLSSRLACLAIAVAALWVVPNLTAAAGPPPVKVEEPVSVDGTVKLDGPVTVQKVTEPVTVQKVNDPIRVSGLVSVQGMVEELNDVLRTPFFRSAAANEINERPHVDFDIPEGKRLIIESIAFQATEAATDTNRMFMFVAIPGQLERFLVPLPIQSSVTQGPTKYLISMIPLKMRIDSIPGHSAEIRFERGTGSVGTLTACIFGYLVDK